jgi:cysteine desulfurase
MTYRRTVYLDYAAATPLDERVFDVMRPYLIADFYNPSSPYMAANVVKRAVREAKHTIASTIGAKTDEVVMTAGATESVNLAIRGVMEKYPGKQVVTCSVEHPAVLETVKRFSNTIMPVEPTGLVNLEELKKAINDNTVLVSIGYANSELGTVQPLREIAQALDAVCQARLKSGNATPLYLHSDASQAAGYLDINTARLGVDLLTLNAAKCYGPKQVGLLWIRPGIQLEPVIYGGGQEYSLRSGTENVPGIIGFAKAIQLAEANRKLESELTRNLRDKLQKKLQAAFDNMVINGHQKRRLPGHLNVSWEGLDAERALYALDMRGVMVATGSACAANKGTRSHVLEAIGLSPEVADGSLRITIGKQTSKEDIEYAADCIIETVNKEISR